MKIKLNPDQEIVNTIREGLKRTGGYCPCRLERTEATKCVSGVQGSDRRSQFRGLLPLSALLQIFEGLRLERYAVKTIGRRGHDAMCRLRRV